MNPFVKVGLVVAGYALAVAVAVAAVMCRMILIGDSGAQTSGGMSAFGDSLLFLAVFAVAALLPTGAALFFLRPYQAFWRWFSVAVFVFALSSFAAFIIVIADPRSVARSFAFLRVLVAPCFTLAFGLSVFFAPQRGSRIALLVAAGIEIAGFACWVITCLVRNL
jgi:hypothetical protein